MILSKTIDFSDSISKPKLFRFSVLEEEEPLETAARLRRELADFHKMVQNIQSTSSLQGKSVLEVANEIEALQSQLKEDEQGLIQARQSIRPTLNSMNYIEQLTSKPMAQSYHEEVAQKSQISQRLAQLEKLVLGNQLPEACDLASTPY